MGAKFCTRCGRPLGADGRCVNCSRLPASKAQAPRSSQQPAKKRRALPIVLAVLVALLLAATTVGILMLANVIPNPFKKDAGGKQEDPNREPETAYEFEHKKTPPEYISETMIERPDTRKTLEEIGTIVSETHLADSQTMQTGAEAYRDLADRGFTQNPVTTSYETDGTLLEEEKEISYSAEERRPVYETYYVTENDVVWVILSVNGKIFANPLSFNADANWQTTHIVSESNMFIRYDGAAKTFIEVVPNPSKVYVKTVERIDAAKLDALTAEEVDN